MLKNAALAVFRVDFYKKLKEEGKRMERQSNCFRVRSCQLTFLKIIYVVTFYTINCNLVAM